MNSVTRKVTVTRSITPEGVVRMEYFIDGIVVRGDEILQEVFGHASTPPRKSPRAPPGLVLWDQELEMGQEVLSFAGRVDPHLAPVGEVADSLRERLVAVDRWRLDHSVRESASVEVCLCSDAAISRVEDRKWSR